MLSYFTGASTCAPTALHPGLSDFSQDLGKSGKSLSAGQKTPACFTDNKLCCFSINEDGTGVSCSTM